MPISTAQPILGPVLGLASWTFVMEVWLYALRIPAFNDKKYDIQMHPNLTRDEIKRKLPHAIERPADNYAHLHEQPTVFYAVALALAVMDVQDAMTVNAAWVYVGIRVVHSVVQSTNNVIAARFGLFASSSVVLLGLTLRTASLLW